VLEEKIREGGGHDSRGTKITKGTRNYSLLPNANGGHLFNNGGRGNGESGEVEGEFRGGERNGKYPQRFSKGISRRTCLEPCIDIGPSVRDWAEF